MRHIVTQSRYVVRRSLFSAYVFSFLATGGITLYLLAPLSSYLFFGDFRFWRKIRQFPRLLAYGYAMVRRYFTDPRYRRVFKVPVHHPPMSHPDYARVSLAPSWPHGLYDCGGCVNCCKVIGCPLVDEKLKGCLCYDSFYWRYFNCGRFPVQANQLEYYGCAKWSFGDE